MPRVSSVSETFSQEGPSSLLAKALGMELKKDQPHTELLVHLQGIYWEFLEQASWHKGTHAQNGLFTQRVWITLNCVEWGVV